jgi:4-amino-4-deoxy-L-arabinose transferase-like glycosyltransferase
MNVLSWFITLIITVTFYRAVKDQFKSRRERVLSYILLGVVIIGCLFFMVVEMQKGVLQ